MLKPYMSYNLFLLLVESGNKSAIKSLFFLYRTQEMAAADDGASILRLLAAHVFYKWQLRYD